MLHGGVERGLTDVAKDGLGQKVEWKSEYELAARPPENKKRDGIETKTIGMKMPISLDRSVR